MRWTECLVTTEGMSCIVDRVRDVTPRETLSTYAILRCAEAMCRMVLEDLFEKVDSLRNYEDYVDLVSWT